MPHIVSVMFFLFAGAGAIAAIASTVCANRAAMMRAWRREPIAAWSPTPAPAAVRIRPRPAARPIAMRHAPLRAAA